MQVEFDSTLDEIAEVNMLLVEHTNTYRQQRRESQWAVGLCVAGGLVVILASRAYSPSYAALALAAVAGVIGGVAAALLYGRFHGWYVRRHYRRMMQEMHGGAEQVHFEFELRDEVLSIRSMQTELTFPWSRLARVNDTPGSIELWFDPGLAVVRDRAFRTAEERTRFLDAVRLHLRSKAV